MKKLMILLLLISVSIACKENTTSEKSNELITESAKDKVLTTAETIAFKNGIENWKDVNTINFTFNVSRNDKSNGGRAWTWNPKTDDVTMITQKDTISFNRKAIDSLTKRYDAAFINDKFWLLAPFNLVWDRENTTIKEQMRTVAPISKDSMNMLTVTYGNEGGYTPGDAYDFYYDNDFMIQEWVFRKGNAAKASMTTTWEEYEDFKGLKIAKMHKDETGSLKLFFTNISVD